MSDTRANPICPRCGAETDREAVGERADRHRELCRECYLEVVEFIDAPATITIEQCRGCESIRTDGDWEDTDETRPDLAVAAVQDALGVHINAAIRGWSVTPEPRDDATIAVLATFTLEIEGTFERRQREIEVSFEQTTCPRCRKIADQDFASTIQLRATDRDPSETEVSTARELIAAAIDDRVADGDRGAYVADVTERDGGLDVKLSTTALGRSIAKQLHETLGGELSATERLITTDGDGQDVYRMTHVLRLPRYREGDVIAWNDGAALIESVGERVRVRDLTTGEIQFEAIDDLDVEPWTHRRDAESATVVTPLDEHALQVLDPETQAAVTVPRYPDVDIDGETVESVRVDGTLYVLPSDA